MKKTLKIAAAAALVFCMLLCLGLVRDRMFLRENLIRLHVVGASDSDEDQAIKLRVKDAVVTYLSENMQGISGVEEAKAYLCTQLTALENVANEALASAGSGDRAVVTLAAEEFPVRYYDTFTLPSGVYESLRVEIGPAQGRNWWCVVFPGLCVGTTREELRDTAAGAGFSQTLTDTITDTQEYEIRFFLLDCLGALENFFHAD